MKDFYGIKPQSMFRCSDGYDGSMKDWEQLQNKTTIEAWKDSGTDGGNW